MKVEELIFYWRCPLAAFSASVYSQHTLLSIRGLEPLARVSTSGDKSDEPVCRGVVVGRGPGALELLCGAKCREWLI